MAMGAIWTALAEGLIGIQNNVREKVLRGELSAFTTDDVYVKFEKAEF